MTTLGDAPVGWEQGVCKLAPRDCVPPLKVAGAGYGNHDWSCPAGSFYASDLTKGCWAVCEVDGQEFARQVDIAMHYVQSSCESRAKRAGGICIPIDGSPLTQNQHLTIPLALGIIGMIATPIINAYL